LGRRRRRRKKKKNLLTESWEFLRDTPFIFITEEERNYLAEVILDCARSSFWQM
jgi:hypothetical protein